MRRTRVVFVFKAERELAIGALEHRPKIEVAVLRVFGRLSR